MNYKRIKRKNSPVLFLFMSYSWKTVVEKEPQNSAIRNLFLAEAVISLCVYKLVFGVRRPRRLESESLVLYNLE